MTQGRSVRLYLVDGTATGILTAEIMNWTGHVLSAPRTRLEVVLRRSELKRTGIYLLFGPDEDGSDLQKVYVGESDDIAKRIYQHNRDEAKQFWEKFVSITSKDMNLTKAHVKYLEGRLLDLLEAAKKTKIVNKDNPNFDKLPEADISDMENFLSEIELILPVIGIDYLKKPRKVSSAIESKSFESDADKRMAIRSHEFTGEVFFELKNSKAGISARAAEIDGEFVLIEGSIGSLKEKVSFHDRIKQIRDDAFETGRVEKLNENNFKLCDEIAFSSPSAASVFLFGTSRNGRTDWIETETSKNYGEWKDSLISDEPSIATLDGPVE